MSAPAERVSAAPYSDVTIGDLRQHLSELVALAATSEKPHPTRVNPADHPMPGHEWSVKAHMPKVLTDHFYRRDRDGWLIRASSQPVDSDCIYVSTPDAMDAEDFMPIPTTSARQLAMAILAACDQADVVRNGVSSLADRRTHRTEAQR